MQFKNQMNMIFKSSHCKYVTIFVFQDSCHIPENFVLVLFG